MAGPNIITTDINQVDGGGEASKVVDALSKDIATNFVQEQLVNNEAVGAYRSSSGKLTSAQTKILEEMEKKAREALTDFFKQIISTDGKITLRYQAPEAKTDESFNIQEFISSFEHSLTSFTQVTQRIKQDKQIEELQGKLDAQSNYQQLKDKQERVNQQGRRLAFQTNWFQRNVLIPKTRAERYRRVVAMGLRKFQDETGKIPEAQKWEATNYIMRKIRARRSTSSRLFSKRTFGLSEQFNKAMPGTRFNSIFVRRHNKPFTTSEMDMLRTIYEDLKSTYEKDDNMKDTAELDFLLMQLKEMHGDILETHENQAEEHQKAVDAFKSLEKSDEETS